MWKQCCLLSFCIFCEDKVGHFIFRWDKSLKLKSEAKSFVWDLINMQNKKYETKSLQLKYKQIRHERHHSLQWYNNCHGLKTQK